MFTYKRDPNDTSDRTIIDLRKSKLLKGKRVNGEPYIEIDGQLKISFESQEDYQKWAQVFIENKMTD